MREDRQGRHGPGACPPQAWELLSDVPLSRAAGSQAGEPVTCHAGDSRTGVLGCGSGRGPRQAVPGWLLPSSGAACVNQSTFKSRSGAEGMTRPFIN